MSGPRGAIFLLVLLAVGAVVGGVSVLLDLRDGETWLAVAWLVVAAVLAYAAWRLAKALRTPSNARARSGGSE